MSDLFKSYHLLRVQAEALQKETKQLQIENKELEANLEKAIRIMKGLWLSYWADRFIVDSFLSRFDKPEPESSNRTKETKQ